MTLRVNTLKTDRNGVLKILDERKVESRACRYIDYFITVRLMSKLYLDEAFQNGLFTVQDESAGLPSILLRPTEHDEVLDMCAAPGGKSTHIAQFMRNNGKIFAVDKHEPRLNMMKETAERLGVTNIEFIQDDSTDFQNEILKDKLFDKILIDAPCSGLGVLSKKPEIRWKREYKDIVALAELQLNLLNNAAKHVKQGGTIVYSTCTTEPEENIEVVKKFLSAHQNFLLDNANNYVSKELVNADGCVETFQHRNGIDGSFAARLVRLN